MQGEGQGQPCGDAHGPEADQVDPCQRPLLSQAPAASPCPRTEGQQLRCPMRTNPHSPQSDLVNPCKGIPGLQTALTTSWEMSVHCSLEQAPRSLLTFVRVCAAGCAPHPVHAVAAATERATLLDGLTQTAAAKLPCAGALPPKPFS